MTRRRASQATRIFWSRSRARWSAAARMDEIAKGAANEGAAKKTGQNKSPRKRTVAAMAAILRRTKKAMRASDAPAATPRGPARFHRA